MSNFALREVHSCSCGDQVMTVRWYGGRGGQEVTLNAEPVVIDGWEPVYQYPDYFVMVTKKAWTTHICPPDAVEL